MALPYTRDQARNLLRLPLKRLGLHCARWCREPLNNNQNVIQTTPETTIKTRLPPEDHVQREKVEKCRGWDLNPRSLSNLDVRIAVLRRLRHTPCCLIIYIKKGGQSKYTSHPKKAGRTTTPTWKNPENNASSPENVPINANNP